MRLHDYAANLRFLIQIYVLFPTGMEPVNRKNKKTPDPNKPDPNKHRRVNSLGEKKAEKIKKIDDSGRFAGEGHVFGVNESTICSIFTVCEDAMKALTAAAL